MNRVDLLPQRHGGTEKKKGGLMVDFEEVIIQNSVIRGYLGVTPKFIINYKRYFWIIFVSWTNVQ